MTSVTKEPTQFRSQARNIIGQGWVWAGNLIPVKTQFTTLTLGMRHGSLERGEVPSGQGAQPNGERNDLEVESTLASGLDRAYDADPSNSHERGSADDPFI